MLKHPKYDGYQRGIASMIYKCFNKRSSGAATRKEIMQNKVLAKELHKPIIRKIEKRKVRSSFTDNIWAADLADMQLVSKYNIGFRLLLCLIEIYYKYASVIPLSNKKAL